MLQPDWQCAPQNIAKLILRVAWQLDNARGDQGVGLPGLALTGPSLLPGYHSGELFLCQPAHLHPATVFCRILPTSCI